jgi:uncharacterized protein
MSTKRGTHLLVMAKEPRPGRVKTRLCPPCSPVEAAEIAVAALADTLEAVAGCGADRLVLALDGRPGPWLPTGFEVVAQEAGTFAERLDAAWAWVGGPGLQIGMDTPQVTAGLLDASLARLLDPGVDAVLGPALDGGWWAIGLHRHHPGLFDGIPMSTGDTGRCQAARLADLGLDTIWLPALRDLDTILDAEALAAKHPSSHTAAVVDRVGLCRAVGAR